MEFAEPLTNGTLIKRYKRFLADIRLDSGEIITAHCPNTGTMLSCSAPGSRVGLSRSENRQRKYPFTLEMIQAGKTWVGVNTARTNGLVAEAIENGHIIELRNITRIKREIRISSHTRLDLQVIHGDGSSMYIEVKNCSLATDGCAMFPDAVTARGTKHLQELSRLSKEGVHAGIFFLVQRTDADRFAPARHIDPVYGQALDQAIACGVNVLIYQAEVSPKGIHVVRALPHSLAVPAYRFR